MYAACAESICLTDRKDIAVKKVLAFFGAFNPPTKAHIELGRYAMEQTGRESVLYVPSKASYIKEDQGKSFAYKDQDRLAMLGAVAEHNSWMEVIDREIRSDVQPRTYDTLCYLRDCGYQPSLLFGSDKLAELEHGWKHVEEIVTEFGIVCMCRGMDDVQQMVSDDPYLKSLSFGITMLETPLQLRRISSTTVRNILQQIQQIREVSGQELSFESSQESPDLYALIYTLKELVPEEVAETIVHQGLIAGQIGGKQ